LVDFLIAAAACPGTFGVSSIHSRIEDDAMAAGTQGRTNEGVVRPGLVLALALALAMLALAPGSAWSQATYTVAGTVRCDEGHPLAGAQVVVVATGRATVADLEGRFELRGLAPGVHSLEATMVGHAPARRRVVVEPGVAPAPTEIVLTPTPLSLPGVQVTATPGGRDALGVAQATVEVAGQALERNLGMSLAQTLAFQPGMAVRYNGPGVALPILRGLTGDRILILQDGQRTADLSGSDDHALTLDPLAAQRIEVVRGPASLLYGSNALGGVVNVVSADIPFMMPTRPQLSATLQSESAFPGAAASVRSLVPLGERWALTLRGSGRSAGDARIGGDPVLGKRLANTAHRAHVGAVGLGYLGERVTGGVTFQRYGFQHGLPMPPGEDEELVLRGAKYQASGRADVALGSELFSFLRVQGMATAYAHEELEDGVLEMALALRTQSLDALVRQNAVGRVTEGAWGVSGLFRQYAATGEDQLTAPADSRAMGIFTFQEVALAEDGPRLQLGARADRYRIASKDDPRFGAAVERSFTALSGSVGLNVPVGDGASASLSLARSFRAPTVEELFSNAYHMGTASYELGDPTLRPEFANGLDAVLRIHRPRLSLDLSAYGTLIQDFVGFEVRGDTTIAGSTWPVMAYVQDGARFVGAEGQVHWVLGRHFVLGASADVVRARSEDGTPVAFMPPARLGASLRRDDGLFSFGAGVRHALRQDRVGLADELATDAYTLFDLDVGLRRVRAGRVHALVIRGENLADVLYRDATSRIKEFAPNPGRNLSVFYRVSF
jgi:iron complex outermembrane recepter protein